MLFKNINTWTDYFYTLANISTPLDLLETLMLLLITVLVIGGFLIVVGLSFFLYCVSMEVWRNEIRPKFNSKNLFKNA